MKRERGFTLVELMVVVVIIGLLAAWAIPNYLASQSRAREASVKNNMHLFQIAAEDFRARTDSTYAGDAADVAAAMTPFRNPFDQSVGAGSAWENRPAYTAEPTAHVGIVSYADSSGDTYNIKGYGHDRALDLVLSNSR